MLIRSSPQKLESKRFPIGPVRLNKEHPLAPYCRGLWLFSTNAWGQDLAKFNAPLTFNLAGLATKWEGPSLDATVAVNSGAYAVIPAYQRISTGHGLSIYARWSATSTAPDQFASIFTISYDNFTLNPYVASSIFRNNATDLYWGYNYAGTYNSSGPLTVTTANAVTSNVNSHIFGTSYKAYQSGVEIGSDTTNVAAPAYGTNPQVQVGADTYNNRNAQSNIYTAAIFARGLSAAEALDLEINPYALVEPARTFLWMGKSTAAAASGGTNILLANTFDRPFNSFGRPF